MQSSCDIKPGLKTGLFCATQAGRGMPAQPLQRRRRAPTPKPVGFQLCFFDISP